MYEFKKFELVIPKVETYTYTYTKLLQGKKNRCLGEVPKRTENEKGLCLPFFVYYTSATTSSVQRQGIGQLNASMFPLL